MSWIQHNNAPLLGAQAVVDTSQWSSQYRDGQKLRQEYDARQHQKALGEIMKIGDHNGRLEAAQQHKYAGALIPMLQEYDEKRNKAALDNLKTSADISKVYGETGKLGAETGKLNAETVGVGVKVQNETLDGLVKKYDQISAGALTQNPQYFGLMLGDFENNGLINPEQKGMLINMIMKDPENAAVVMQGLAKGSIEGFKATTPAVQSTNLGNRQGFTSYDPQTGQMTGLGDFAIGQSPDNAATNATSITNNQNTVKGQIYASDNTLEGTKYSSNNSLAGTQYTADQGLAGKVYATDSAAETNAANTAVNWYKAETGAAVAQQNANTATQKANNPRVNRTPVPPSAMKVMGELEEKLVSNHATLTNNLAWMNKLKSGELQLGAVANTGNVIAKATGINSIGSNPQAYSEFKAYITDLANKALRLNAGVQTDADYKRQLDAIVAGSGLPRNNDVAYTLLNRMHNDFATQNKATYQNLAKYTQEYQGAQMGTYGRGSKAATTATPAKTSAGKAIGNKVFGGK